MKQAVFIILFGIMLCSKGFAAGCNTDHTLTFKGTQSPSDDEFLYLNQERYDESVQGYANTRKQNSGSGIGYECDRYHSSGCTIGQTVTMPKGHVFKGNKIDTERTYKCVKGFLDDRWEVINEDDKYCNTRQFGNIPVNGVYEKLLSKSQCSGYSKTDETHGASFQLRCLENRNLLCWAMSCDESDMTPNENGVCERNKKHSCTATIKGKNVILDVGAEYNVDLTADECIAAVRSVSTGSVYKIGLDVNGLYHFFCEPGCKRVGCKKGYEEDEQGMCVKKGGDKKTCRERRVGMSVEAIACCDTGTDAVWDSPIKGKCNCKDSNTHFEIINGRGQCVANVTPPPVVVPPVIVPPIIPVPQPCSDPDNMDSNCKCVVPETVERGGRCVCTDSNKEIKNGKCEYTAGYVAQLQIDIDSKYSNIKSLTDGFKTSVWKNAEGNFNTARLASDSIAGVVLGTVGGVVTANVVKKNQIKKGFEDIQCYIGGQSVADFGDDFVVGR